MFEHAKITTLNDYFLDCTKRTTKRTYFCRIMEYSEEINIFLEQYFKEVKKCGVYIKGKLSNPEERQLEYYEEIMGLEFEMSASFIKQAIHKWLPRVQEQPTEYLVEAIMSSLHQMQEEGKNINIIKNAYIKFMCWLYYKFERILNCLGGNIVPKILYEGTISKYELSMLIILSKAGCDILLLEYEGDQSYLKFDSNSIYSERIQVREGKKFPPGFNLQDMTRKIPSINQIREEQQGSKNQTAKKKQPIQILQPTIPVQSNTWIFGEIFSDALKAPANRGGDERFIFNLFAKVVGVEEKATYYNELLTWKLKLESLGRTILLLEQHIPVPEFEEIQKIPRKNYGQLEYMIQDLLNYIVFPKNKEIERYAKVAFCEMMQEERETSIQKLTNRAISFVCWLKKYLPVLFEKGNEKSIPVVLFYGACQSINEAFFLRLLARMPIDVIIICPDTSLKCKLNDCFLFEKRFPNSLPLEKFPIHTDGVTFGTTAYHAEKDLDTMMYQDTGIYRNRQFKKAIPITLQTTYEEIKILWKQETKFRPNFETLSDRVMLPVIFAKVSGVEDGKEKYWKEIADMITEDTVLIPTLPFIRATDYNPMKQYVTNFIRNGKVLINKIKNHPSFPYAFIREDMQDYMMDKLQQLIEKRVIKGTFVNGTEYTILSTILSLDKNTLRMIQKFDFTKENPKLIVISTKENVCSIEDSILVAYMNMLGFDVVIFVPTGYQSVERYFEHTLFVEHQVGEYIYDLDVPNFETLKNQKESFASKLFRRGK